MKKAFFSFAIIAVVSAALILFAAYAKSWYDYRQAQNYALEARLVGQRANDSQYFLSGLLDDVILDSAYASLGCGSSKDANATDFCEEVAATAPRYYPADADLSPDDAITYRNTSAYLVQCGNWTWSNYWAAPNDDYNTTFLYVNITANYTVNSTNARKHADIVIEKLVFINKSRAFAGYASGYLNVNTTNPYGRNMSYFVDCS